MKHLRKTLSLLMVFCLLFGLSATVFALDLPTDISGERQQDDVSKHNFKAYQIFAAEYATDAEGKPTDELVAITWGNGLSDPEAMWKELVGTESAKGILYDKLSGTVFSANIEGQSYNPSAYKLAEELGKLAGYSTETGTSNETALAFSRVVSKYLNDGSDGTTDEGKEPGQDLPAGYYLIVDTTTDGAVVNLSYLMMSSTTAFVPTVKVNVPSVDKKVAEVDDTTGSESWADAADYDIGDTVEFVLTGTLPSTGIDEYETYYYQFEDTLSSGLTLDEGSIKVYLNNEQTPLTGYDFAKTENGFTVTFTDLKEVEGITARSVIYVRYTATLNGGAVVGSVGNGNTVKLNYSNNPNTDGRGETPDKTVKVYTYSLTINKVDQNNAPLNGAGFTLYKKVMNGGTGEWIVAEVSDPAAEGETKTEFRFAGLDAGDYRLVESTVPSGYNKVDDMYFTISHVDDGNVNIDGSVHIDVIRNGEDENSEILKDAEGKTVTVTGEGGALETSVVNMSGLKLPSTGGIGTTIFYIVGGLLLVGAGVLLVAKKRMGGNE